jgi:hypothetical protein
MGICVVGSSDAPLQFAIRLSESHLTPLAKYLELELVRETLMPLQFRVSSRLDSEKQTFAREQLSANILEHKASTEIDIPVRRG